MDLAEICRVMRRRWYVLLPGLLLTAVLAGGAYLAVPMTYQSQSTVMLLNSESATKDFDGNPFLSTQTSLTSMADSLARNLNSDTSVTDMKSEGATGTTSAKIADNALGPLMWLTATGTDKQSVLRTDKVLTAYAEKRLDQMQDEQSVSAPAKIRMTTIVPPQTPLTQSKTRTEYLILAVLLGFVLSVAAAFYTEARRRGAPTRQAAEPAAGTGGKDVQETPAEAPSDTPSEPVAQEPVARPAARTVRSAPRWSAADADGAVGDTGGADQDAADGAAATEPQAPRYV